MSIKNNLKAFLAGSSILILSNIALKAVQFFLLPLYTKHLTPELLGINDTITTLTTLLFPLLVMAFDSAFSAFYYDVKTEVYSKQVFNTAFFFLAIQAVIPLLLLFVSSWISSMLFGSPIYSAGIKIALISVSVNLLYLPFSLLIRMENRMKVFALINITGSILMIFLNIAFLVILQWGFMALLASSLITNALQLLLYVILAGIKIKKRLYQRTLFKNMLRFALPLVPMTVFTWILNMSDRYMILYFCGESAVGLYGIGARFVTVMAAIISGLMTAYTTFAFQNAREDGAKDMFVNVINIVFVILGGVCVTITIFGKEVIALMTSEAYESSYILLAGLLFGQMANAIGTLVGYGIAFEKKSKFLLYAVMAAGIGNIILNFIFIPKFGIEAAAITTLASNIMQFSIIYYFSQKSYYCNFNILTWIASFTFLFGTSIVFRDAIMPIKIIIWIADASVILFVYRNRVKDFIKFLK